MSIRSNVDRAALNERVTIQRAVETFDPITNDPTTTWTTLIVCWARVDAAKVTERYREPEISGGIRSVADYTVWIRADVAERIGLKLTDKLIWRDQTFDIKDAPDNQLRGRLRALVCRQGLTSG